MSQRINLRAVQWAYEQDDLSATAKAVLMTFAIHADKRGYTWPGVGHIMSKWNMAKTTVCRQIKVLLVRRLISPTKKKRGATGQVKVYRLPEITWERGAISLPFENDQRGAKEKRKGSERGNILCPRIINNEQRKDHDQGAAKTLGNSIPTRSRNTSDSFSGSHQNTPARDHHKWREFAAYCHSQPDKHGQPGQPTEKGFWTWLSKQKPQWRNTVAPKFAGEHGYVLNGKFYIKAEAIEYAKQHPELLDQDRFRKAIRRRDGTIKIIAT